MACCKPKTLWQRICAVKATAVPEQSALRVEPFRWDEKRGEGVVGEKSGTELLVPIARSLPGACTVSNVFPSRDNKSTRLFFCRKHPAIHKSMSENTRSTSQQQRILHASIPSIPVERDSIGPRTAAEIAKNPFNSFNAVVPEAGGETLTSFRSEAYQEFGRFS